MAEFRRRIAVDCYSDITVEVLAGDTLINVEIADSLSVIDEYELKQLRKALKTAVRIAQENE